MAQIIQYGTNFDPASTFVPDVYLEIIPPQAYLSGVPVSVTATIGTGSYGPVNSPQLIGNPQQLQRIFGPVQPAAVTDIHDLVFDISTALNQATAQGLSCYGIRVTDGTDTAGVCVLTDGTSPSESITITSTGAPIPGDQVTLKFVNPSIAGGFTTVDYTVVSADTNATVAAGLNTAMGLNAALTGAGITATVLSNVITVDWSSGIGGIQFSSSLFSESATLTVAGTPTNTEVPTIRITNSALPGGFVTIPYTVGVSDTNTTIAAGFVTAIGLNGSLSAQGITASNIGPVLSIVSTSIHPTSYNYANSAHTTFTLANGPSEIVAFANLGGAGITLTDKYTGSLGNQFQAVISAGNMPNTANVQIVPFSGGGTLELYTNLPTTGSQFWAALQTAINMGQGAARGPSNLVTASGASGSASSPLLGTFLFSGGTDGRSVTSAQLLGSNVGTPTGIYCLSKVQFTPSVAWIAGLTDSTIYAAILGFAQLNNIFFLLTFPSDTTAAAAVAAKQSYGIANFQIGFTLLWVYVFDQANGVVRLVPPLATAGGFIGTLAPEQSPFNKAVSGVIGTERNSPYTGNAPFSDAEIAQCTQAGIMFLDNPIPAGFQFGFRNGCNSVGNNDVTSPVEYSRLTNYLVFSNASILGKFEGMLQSAGVNDSYRAQVSAALNQFYANLLSAGRIGGFNVQCNLTNNSFGTISQHESIIDEQVNYLSSVLYILARIQGGTTVQTAQNQLGQQIQA